MSGIKRYHHDPDWETIDEDASGEWMKFDDHEADVRRREDSHTKEIERLREQLRLANIDAANSESERSEVAEALFKMAVSITPDLAYDSAEPGLMAKNMILRFSEVVAMLDRATTGMELGSLYNWPVRDYSRLTSSDIVLCETILPNRGKL